MPAFGPPIEPLGVEHAIDLVRTQNRPVGERRREGLRIRAPALEAGPVTGRQCGRLVEKEQFGIARAPDVAMPSLEVEAATNPTTRDPASSAEGPVGVMEAPAAIAE